MEEVLLFIRIVLAGVFALAGIGKIMDPAGSAKAVRDFGVPESVAAPLGYVLPAAELVIAACLLFVSTSWLGAIGSSVLLVAFVGGMLWQYSQGKAPECHCFGQMHSEPVSPKSIARNVLLLSLSLLLVFAGRGLQGMPLANSGEGMIQTLLLLGLGLIGVIALSMLNRVVDSQREISRKIELLELLSTGDVPRERQDAGSPDDGVPVGALFPDFELNGPSGARTGLAQLLEAGRPILFFFVGPNCSPCKALMPEIVGWAQRLKGRAEVVMMTSGGEDENRGKIEAATGIRLLFDVDREIAQSVYAKWTPSAILVRADGRVASHVAVGDAAIRTLVERLEKADNGDRPLYIKNGNPDKQTLIGEPVPDFKLATAQGEVMSSDQLRGRQTLAVFWSTTCPHCIAMMSELKDWETRRDADDPDLIVFSEGDASAHRDVGLEAPILLESGYKTAIGLGMQGTPSAVLIDENGNIASETAIGARNIWSLVRARR